MASAAQAVIDEWSQDEEGWDEEFGAGGACDRVSGALAGVIGSLDDVEIVDGGHDGDDHAWLVVYDDEEAYSVDIPPGVYETGGGYSWTKLEDAKVSPEDVEIFKLNRRDVVAVFKRSSSPVDMGPKALDLSGAALRVASSSVEAARRSKRKKPAKGGRKTMRETRPDRRPAPLFEADMTAPVTEYSCQIELSMSADFEGQIEKQRLIKKLKAELTASLRAAMGIVARDFGLQSTGVEVRPIRVECAVSDHS